MRIRLGSRGSALARWQAEDVRTRLERAHRGLRVEVCVLRTTGDRVADVPLARIGDRGLFTKEIDAAVLAGEVHAAVHSLKDLPTEPAEGLAVAAVLEREDPRDALLPAPGRPAVLADYAPGARIGTSSLRRRAQLLHAFPNLTVDDLRGNLDTRLARLEEGRYDAAILALAGVRRLGREDAIGQVLDLPDWLPAAGQGALAITTRADDANVNPLVATLDDPAVRAATTAEREFLRALEGGCQIPIGALASPEGETLRLRGFVASLDGRRLLRGELVAAKRDGAMLGRRLAQELLDRGAGIILRDVRNRAEETLPRASAP